MLHVTQKQIQALSKSRKAELKAQIATWLESEEIEAWTGMPLEEQSDFLDGALDECGEYKISISLDCAIYAHIRLSARDDWSAIQDDKEINVMLTADHVSSSAKVRSLFGMVKAFRPNVEEGDE